MNKKELLFLKLSSNTKVPIKNEKFSDERNLKKINEKIHVFIILVWLVKQII